MHSRTPGSRRAVAAALVSAALVATGAQAGDVSVLAAELRSEAPGRWHASVTLEHADSGWEHYADAWRVVGTDGSAYGTRTLYHPHENEQPFTRGLGGIVIPEGAGRVWIEAHDKVHGWSPVRLEVDLSAARDGRVRATR